MPLLNNFLVGADPEFVIVDQGSLKQFNGRAEAHAPWGLDHSNWVIEPHPKPELSVREVINNLKIAMNDFATVAPTGKWRAGAWIELPPRNVSLGGHVHIDLPRNTIAQQEAMDRFTEHLEALDILPTTECATRRNGGYGRFGDIRSEHGHFEYRTMASWLFSQRVTKICLIGTKLSVIDPEGVVEVLGRAAATSVKKLQGVFERFAGKDDDVDWVLGSGMLKKKLNVKPDRDLRDVWKVEPKKESPHWKAALAAAARPDAATFNYVHKVRDTFVSFQNDPARLREPGDPQLDFVDQFMTEHPNWQGWGPGGLNRFYVWGKEDTPWRDNTPSLSVRIQVNNLRYRFKVSRSQAASSMDALRAVLRNYVEESPAAARFGSTMQVRSGFIFESRGQEIAY